ncbi:MAG TPA: hypothetical protein VK527_04535 [Candidatus Limnocylindrales bacterium]|nr:hypothetical protein [Candidatus Limnocylindrales bacterium]
MNVRVAGIAVICAAAACAMLSGAGRAESLSGSETMMRRQPAPTNPRTTPTARRLRKGTISLGGQIGYGFVRGSSELNDHFDGGVGYGFRFRYALTSRTALGFSFESQRYSPRAGLPPDTGPFAAVDSELVVTTVASEMVVFFHRERDTTPYLLGGLGYASPNVTYGSKESRRIDEGPFLVVGAGLERFVRPRVALDFSVRGYAEVGNSELSLFSQIVAGIHLYPGD